MAYKIKNEDLASNNGYSNVVQGALGNTGTNKPETTPEPDYYQQLKSESYKALLDKEVQAYNAQEQARKYTNNALMGQGYGSQGMAESSNLGISNMYQNALRGAREDYKNDLYNIANQQRQDTNENFQSIASLMGGTTSTEQLGEVMRNYKLINPNGSWNETELSKFDTNTQRQLKTLYSLYNSEFANSEWLSNNTLNGEGYKSAIDAKKGFEINTSINSYDGILNKIFTPNFQAKMKEGSALKIEKSSSDSNAGLYLIYKNGSWYQTSAYAYSQSKDKHQINNGNYTTI